MAGGFLPAGQAEESGHQEDHTTKTDSLVSHRSVCLCLSTCLSTCLPVHLSVCLSSLLSVHLSLCLSVCPLRCRRPKSQQPSVVLMWDRLLLLAGTCEDTIQYPLGQ